MNWDYTWSGQWLDLADKRVSMWDSFGEWFSSWQGWGQEGWELCSFTTTPLAGPNFTTGMYVLAVFKRPQNPRS